MSRRPGRTPRCVSRRPRSSIRGSPRAPPDATRPSSLSNPFPSRHSCARRLRVALTPSRSSPPVAVALRVGPRPRRCGRHALGVGSARAVGCLRARLRLRPRPRRVERPSLRRARGARQRPSPAGPRRTRPWIRIATGRRTGAVYLEDERHSDRLRIVASSRIEAIDSGGGRVATGRRRARPRRVRGRASARFAVFTVEPPRVARRHGRRCGRATARRRPGVLVGDRTARRFEPRVGLDAR